MRVGIIAANNIRYSPYIYFYTRILDEIDMDYEVITANRYNLNESFEKHLHVLPWKNHINPLINYLDYANKVKKVLKMQDYDFLIVLTSINAVFLSTWLKRNYNKKYIVDIRDYSHENIYPYYILEKTAIKNSALNVISSKRFTRFLPEAEYCVCHNFDERKKYEYSYHGKAGQIIIGYVGGVSYVNQCIKLMRLVAVDPRFKFEFYGTTSKESLLKNAAREFRCDRIAFHGGYAPEEKTAILANVDILFNAYGNGSQLLDCALSNKLYDALIYKKPILTCKDTYMTEMAGPLAYPIDLTNERSLDDLFVWYKAIDAYTVEEYANNKLKAIGGENLATKEAIIKCFESLSSNGSI